MTRRFFAFPLVRLAAIVGAFAALAAVLLAIAHGDHSLGANIAVTWILTLLLTVSIVVVERLTTGRRLAAIGLGSHLAARDFAFGLAFGALLFSTVVLELALAGCYRVTETHPTWELATAALLFLPSAALEELLFRGALFRLVEEWQGTWIALAISAILFGAAHAFNPGASWISSLAIALEAGVLLGSAYVVTRNLWLPIGLHFAWNYCEGPIYGTQISGHVVQTSLLTVHLSGPAWLTGGAFGPEAGAGAIVTCSLAAVALLVYATRNSLLISRRSYAASHASAQNASTRVRI